MMNIAQTEGKKIFMLLSEIELLARVCKAKLTTELYLFMRDIILCARYYVVNLPFVFKPIDKRYLDLVV